MGNQSSGQPSNRQTKQGKFQLNCCQALCDGKEDSNSQNKLEPIIFSDMGSSQINESSLNRSKLSASAKSMQQPKVGEQTSDSLKPIVDRDELVIISKEDKTMHSQNGVDYNPLKVSFSVVKLSIDETVLKFMTMINKRFIKQHENSHQKWKLHAKGFYFTAKKHRFIVAKQSQLYEGQLFEDSFTPDKEGVYISSRGAYKGQFKEGKAHGKGCFYGVDFRYEGNWKMGAFEEGIMETKQITFRGTFEGKYPAQGKLRFIQSGTKYNGKFRKGKFHDQNAVYECQEYVYKGGFSDGLRHGEGVLRQKPMVQKRAPQTIKGTWKRDNYVQKKQKK